MEYPIYFLFTHILTQYDMALRKKKPTIKYEKVPTMIIIDYDENDLFSDEIEFNIINITRKIWNKIWNEEISSIPLETIHDQYMEMMYDQIVNQIQLTELIENYTE